ncbi:MAG TPA: hypothetical protein VHN98_12030 [Acidimicrobiales bacterium]|nr:hypothetical protein [Acidimicrobiales bacterium]
MATPTAPGAAPASVSWGAAFIVAVVATVFFLAVTIGLELVARAICGCMP